MHKNMKKTLKNPFVHENEYPAFTIHEFGFLNYLHESM